MFRWIILIPGLALAVACADIGDPQTRDVDAGRTPDAAAIPVLPDAAPTDDAANVLPCVEGVLNAVGPDGACYMYMNVPLIWDEAVAFCDSVGGDAHLAVVTTPEENEVVAAMIGDEPDVWMGANDRDVEDTWVWLTGEPFVYDNWRDGEPNNSGDDGENCIIMEVDNGGTWDDRSCRRTYGFFCERE